MGMFDVFLILYDGMKKMSHLNSINKGNTVAKCHSVAFKNGFTLIRVMVVVVILSRLFLLLPYHLCGWIPVKLQHRKLR